MLKNITKAIVALASMLTIAFALSACSTDVNPDFTTIEFSVTTVEPAATSSYEMVYNRTDKVGSVTYKDNASTVSYLTESDVENIRTAIEATDFANINFDKATNDLPNPNSYILKVDGKEFKWDGNHTPLRMEALLSVLNNYTLKS